MLSFLLNLNSMYMRRRLLGPYLCLLLLSALAAYSPPSGFNDPKSKSVDLVNPLIGNGGDSPNGSGGMIPSTAPPFAMTRWVAQTRENYVSVTPYNYTDTKIHGFQGTHQPAIWMGESAQVVVVPGAGRVQSDFARRGMRFSHDDELTTPSYYRVRLDAIEGGSILAEQSATSRVGHLRFTFSGTHAPYVFLEATRASVMGSSDPSNVTYPSGTIAIDPAAREITGLNPERQDFIIGPNRAEGFRGYFVARFDAPFVAFGTAQNGTVRASETARDGTILGGYAVFPQDIRTVDVRIGVSFISVEQARKNLEKEIPDGTTLEQTAKTTRAKVQGGSREQLQTFYTALFHTLQYPYEQDEDGQYYSGYDDQVHEGVSYTGYSIWDTFRAVWGWQILFAPERIPGMVQSMLQDYKEGGWLPMWKNIVETNIMVGTHADSLIAEAVLKGVTGFDLDLAYEAVYKDATVPPADDSTIAYSDRQENVGYEVRAGLSSVYATRGWVADDIHSESASRTLDYAYDDYAVSVFAGLLGRTEDFHFFRNRSTFSPGTIFNNITGFMEARNASGAWAGPDNGWTEGDNVGLLIRCSNFVRSLDEHFDCGHNDHTNEPSHHIPYLYALADAASRGQMRIRQVARTNYNETVNGLSGNEDCGQMSAWFIYSALGFYPVNPVSDEYVVGSPFFDAVTINLPVISQPLHVIASGASTKPYVKSLRINGEEVNEPIIKHSQIAYGGVIEFEMSDQPQTWASSTI
ncbi:glycosyl hydrolase family 92-domain-containing protein [Lactarius indigo]|nr:glycosyl hydrolase family 92-domain-containing protein [Lactarius indigo]